MTAPDERYARVTPRTMRERQIDTWTCDPPPHLKQQQREIKVGMLRDQRGLRFIARHPDFPQAFEDTDIVRLHQTVCGWYQALFAEQTNMIWEDWLEVVVSGQTINRHWAGVASQGEELSLRYAPILRGVQADGRVVTLIRDRSDVDRIADFPKAKKAGESDAKQMGGREQAYEYAYLPATPDNVAALDALLAGIRGVREKLAALTRGVQGGGNWQAVPLLGVAHAAGE